MPYTQKHFFYFYFLQKQYNYCNILRQNQLNSFFSFYFPFIINFQGTKRYYCKLYLLNIILKKTWQCHATLAAYERSCCHQTSHFKATLEKSRRLKPSEAVHVTLFTTVQHINSLFFFSLLLFPHLDFHIDPLKIQEQPFNLLILHIWSLFLLQFFF